MAEEEDAVKKQELKNLVSGFIKLKTEKEKEKTALSILKVETQWRDLMREVKSKEIEEEMQQMKQSFLKAVGYKDDIIAALEEQLKQTEIQNMWIACGHTKTLEDLISVEYRKSEHLFQLYEEDLEELKKMYLEIVKEIELKCAESSSWFKELNFIKESLFQNLLKKSKYDFTLMDEAINEQVNKEKMREVENFDFRIQTTWKQFQSSLSKYLEDAGAMEKMFSMLRAEYKETIEDAHQDRVTDEELKRIIPQLKAQIEERKNDYLQRRAKVAASHDVFYSNAISIKNKISKLRRDDKAALTQLIKNSIEATRELKRVVFKGERIMKLYKRMKKLEDQIHCDRYETILTSEETSKVKLNSQFTLPINLHIDSNCKYIVQMEKLWERYNTVVLKNLALKKEINDLELHRRKLRSDMNLFMKNVGKDQSQKSQGAKMDNCLVQECALIWKYM